MTTYADIDAFADRLYARRRRAEEAAPPILLALGLPPQSEADGAADTTGALLNNVPSAPVRATAALLTGALSDLGQAEEELRVQNEALFAAHTELEAEQRAVLDLFECAPVAYAVTTADGRVLRVNQEAFELLGQPVNLTAGKPLAVFVAAQDRAAFRHALARPLLTGHVESWRVRLVPKDGDPLECRVRVRAVRLPRAADGAAPEPLLYWVITPELSDPLDDLV